MDLSWRPPLYWVNSDTPKVTFLGVPTKMHLPSAEDLCALIHKVERGCFMVSKDVSQAYHQLHVPLDPGDWPLTCFTFEGSVYVDLSLPFGLRWAAIHCQDVISLVTRDITRQGLPVLNYINDFGGVATSDFTTATDHFTKLQGLLAWLGLQETSHKATSPATTMVWPGLLFDSMAMIVTLPPNKLQEVLDLVSFWVARQSTTTLLSTGFCQALRWFLWFLPSIDGIFIMHEDGHIPVPLSIDVCATGYGVCTDSDAYLAEFPASILAEDRPICHLEALNAVVAL